MENENQRWLEHDRQILARKTSPALIKPTVPAASCKRNGQLSAEWESNWWAKDQWLQILQSQLWMAPSFLGPPMPRLLLSLCHQPDNASRLGICVLTRCWSCSVTTIERSQYQKLGLWCTWKIFSAAKIKTWRLINGFKAWPSSASLETRQNPPGKWSMVLRCPTDRHFDQTSDACSAPPTLKTVDWNLSGGLCQEPIRAPEWHRLISSSRMPRMGQTDDFFNVLKGRGNPLILLLRSQTLRRSTGVSDSSWSGSSDISDPGGY